MKDVADTMMAVAIEAQERHLSEQLAQARKLLDMRLEALRALENEFTREFEQAHDDLRKEFERVKAAKRAMGFPVRAVSGLLE